MPQHPPARPQFGVVDELRYLPVDILAAEHVFGVLSQYYDRMSLIVTTNLPFADWPHIFCRRRTSNECIDQLLETSLPCDRDLRRELPATSQPGCQQRRWRLEGADM
jgi:hypothetical protein